MTDRRKLEQRFEQMMDLFTNTMGEIFDDLDKVEEVDDYFTNVYGESEYYDTEEFSTTREQVYEAIDTEREYQDTLINVDDREDMLELSMGEGLNCLNELLRQASAEWYTDAKPYGETTPYIRKIAGVCVYLMERYGAPKR